MKEFSSYKVQIKHYNHIFEQTVEIYRNAVFFFIDICDKEWNKLKDLRSKERLQLIEKLSLKTKKNTVTEYNFNQKFYKMPSYLRRSSINTATGAYSSYYSNLKNWEKNPVGKKPTLQLDRNVMPTLYNSGMYIRNDETHARIKIFHRNDWVWLNIELKNQDVKYIQKHCKLKKRICSNIKETRKTLVFSISIFG